MLDLGMFREAKLGTSSAGFTLIEVMISLGIVSIGVLAFSSMITNQQRETHALSEKFGTLSLKSLLTSALADGSVCLYELNNPGVLTFDSSSAASIAAASININQIHASYNSISGALGPVIANVNSQASADSTTLWINPPAPSSPPGIQLTGFQGSGTTYTANWTINFNTGKLVRPLNPITIPVTLTADNSTPATTKITGCMTSGSSQGMAKAWVSFSAKTPVPTILDSYNVSSVVGDPEGTTGTYQITFTKPMGSSNYAVLCTSSDDAVGATQVTSVFTNAGWPDLAKSATSVTVNVFMTGDVFSSVDGNPGISVAIFSSN